MNFQESIAWRRSLLVRDEGPRTPSPLGLSGTSFPVMEVRSRRWIEH
jgi:hypothetical protein